jgi:hypothetical protein
VLGLLLVLLGLGSFGISTSLLGWAPRAMLWPWTGSASLVLFVGGILLMKQGRRLSTMTPGSREGQVTASIFLLVALPPIGTALGIYGLALLTTGAARDAFRLGVPDLRAALLQSGLAEVRPLSAKPRPKSLRENVQWFAVRIAIASMLALLFYRWQHTFYAMGGGWPATLGEDRTLLVFASIATGTVIATLHRVIGFGRTVLLTGVAVAFYLFANSTNLSDALRIRL